MTAFDYARTKATADRLIARFGKTATLRQTSETGGNDWDPGSGTTTTTDTTVTVAVIDYQQRDIDGTLVLATDRQALMSAQGLSVVPTPADLLIVGGVSYSIVTVKPVNPGGTVVMYDLQVRA